MVKTQEYTDRIFWQWSDEFDFVKRGDTRYWFPENGFIINSKIRLGDFVEEIYEGRITPKPGQYLAKGIPFIRAQNVLKDTFDFSERKFISPDLHSQVPKAHIKSKDVLLTIDGARLGSACVVPEDFSEGSISNHIVRIIPKKNVSPYFISVFLNSKYGQQNIKQGITGSAQPGLRINAIKNFAIIEPFKKDNVFVDECVKASNELLQQANQKYKQAQEILEKELGLNKVNLKDQTVFWRWSDEIDIVKRLDPNYYQKYFQEQKSLRKKLKIARLEKLSSLIDYGTVPTSPDAPPELGTPYLTGKNIQPNELVLDKLDYLYTATTKDIQDKAIKAGDVVVTQMGTVGNATVMGKKQEGWFFGSFLIRVRPNKDISPEWLALVINSDFGKQQIQQVMTTATVRTNTDLPTIKGLEIPIIDKNKETEIVNFYIQSRSKKALSKQKLQEAKKYVEDLIEGKTK
jgi:restriction endonuclease S subunit